MRKVWKWLDNYWYHYKWPTIVVLFFAVVLAITIPQFLSNEEGDVGVLYSGPTILEREQAEAIQNAFTQLIPEDYNGDGKKQAELTYLFLMTEEQIKDFTSRGGTVSAAAMQTNADSLGADIFSGEMLICLLDPAWYAQYRAEGSFAAWQDTLGYTPEGALDEYAIRLKDTAFGIYFAEVFSVLPDDTVLCMRTIPTANVLKNQKKETLRYQQNLAFFKKVTEFTLP